MTLLVNRMIAIHRSLDAEGVPHAFGGALALAWCTQQARGTIDIDVNVFVSHDTADDVLDLLPPAVVVTAEDRSLIARDGQSRIWWRAKDELETPVDIFFNTTDFHLAAAKRSRIETLAGVDLPFLACADLAVFKAFFNRTKDWADLEEMAVAGTLNVQTVLGVLVDYLGGEDERIERVRNLRGLLPGTS